MGAARLAEVAPGEWDAVLAQAGVTDAYYGRGYVEASALLAGGEPAFLRLAGDGGEVLFPVLVRDDPVDAVTPYGYGGPVCAGSDPPAFGPAYAAWCEARGVLSTFAVLHPLLPTARDAFVTRPLAGTVTWRLEGDDLLAGMHKHHRRLARRALAAELRATVEPAPRALDGFVAVYEESMRRADADPFYFFGADYWDALLRGVPLVRVDVHNGDELVAGVLGMGRPPYLHYHLGGGTDAARRAGGSHLALLTLAEWGREHGYTALHLGGGVGGRADSLLEFKLRFAPDGLTPATIGKAVHDEAAYLARAGAGAVDWDGFFPAYRAPR
jgi:hypothetical protein